MAKKDSERDTKGGDFARRPDLDEVGGSSSDGISEAISDPENLPVDDFWTDDPPAPRSDPETPRRDHGATHQRG